MQDKVLTCKDCGGEFIFAVREQEFFAEKGFSNQPLRCRDCRQMRRSQTLDGSRARTSSRPTFAAVCAACSVETTVPFRPRGDRPVFCRTCYSAKVPAGV